MSDCRQYADDVTDSERDSCIRSSVYTMIEDAREASAQLIQLVGGDLIQEMQKSSPLRSILADEYSSPEIAAEYPFDTVIGNALRQVCGAVTSKRPLQGE